MSKAFFMMPPFERVRRASTPTCSQTRRVGTSIIEISDADADARMEAVASIRRDVGRCNHIAKSMLQFGPDHSAQKEPLSLNELITAARTNLREEIDRHPIRRKLSLESNLPLVKGNATALGPAIEPLIPQP